MASNGITREVSLSRRHHLECVATLFADAVRDVGQFEALGEDQLPRSYASLLAHDDHMTVTLEAYHESLVSVHVVAERTESTWYARQSLLTRHSDGAVVQYGIMRIELSGLPEPVREAITAHSAPLGRILIKNNLLRDVELLALWQIQPASRLAEPLRLAPGQVIYGRSAAIHISGKPAVDLLEIVTDKPVPTQP